MIIVEQSLNVALAFADRAIFMEKGRVRFEGSAQELAERDDLARAVFLGGEGGEMIELLGIEIAQQDLMIGLVTGLTYAAFAAGFVLIYRSTGVLNFAQGEIGAFAVAIFVLLHVRYEINYWLAFILCIAPGAAIGMVIELIVIRRLFESSRLVLLIATIGVGTILAGSKVFLPKVITGGPIPLPFTVNWEPTDHLRLLEREVVILLIVPVLVMGLALFLTRTRFGLAVRASASNPDTARVYGISPKTTSTIVWTIAGAFAAATAILFAPLQGINAAQAGTAALGPPLLLRALVVSLLARMSSIPRALVAGIAVGIIEQVVQSNVPSTDQSIVDLYLFLAVLLVVVFVNRTARDDDELVPVAEGEAHPAAAPAHLVGAEPARDRLRDPLRRPGAAPGLLRRAAQHQFTWTGDLIFAMIACSLSMLTGWAGQLSLGQFAFVGLGGLSMVALTSGHDIPVPFDLFDLSAHAPLGRGRPRRHRARRGRRRAHRAPGPAGQGAVPGGDDARVRGRGRGLAVRPGRLHRGEHRTTPTPQAGARLGSDRASTSAIPRSFYYLCRGLASDRDDGGPLRRTGLGSIADRRPRERGHGRPRRRCRRRG